MERTTPPNRSGFNRKPKSKKRYSGSRRSNAGEPENNSIFEAPNEATAWLYGTMFLMAAAKLLAPFTGLASVANHTSNVKTDRAYGAVTR